MMAFTQNEMSSMHVPNTSSSSLRNVLNKNDNIQRNEQLGRSWLYHITQIY